MVKKMSFSEFSGKNEFVDRLGVSLAALVNEGLKCQRTHLID